MSKPDIANETTGIIQAELKEYGISSWVENRGKHIAVAWTYNGKARTLICARTPSDYRAILNQRGELRRMLKADGASCIKPQVLSFDHALSVPRNPPPRPDRLVMLEQTIDTLVDMMAELQHEQLALKERLANVRANVTLSFDTPSKVEAVLQDTPTMAIINAELAEPVTELGKLPVRRNERDERIIAALAEFNNWVHISEIVKKVSPSVATAKSREYAYSSVSAQLYRLKNIKGLVESGQRGFWKLTADTVREATA